MRLEVNAFGLGKGHNPLQRTLNGLTQRKVPLIKRKVAIRQSVRIKNIVEEIEKLVARRDDLLKLDFEPQITLFLDRIRHANNGIQRRFQLM